MLVALGGYPVYLERNGGGELSFLGGASPVFAHDMDVDEVRALIGAVGSCLRSTDADEVLLRSGGHPHLVKALLHGWADHPEGGWTTAEQTLEDDEDFLVPTLTRVGTHAESRVVFRRLLNGSTLRFPRLVPQSAIVKMYFEGLLKRVGQDVSFRCRAVEKLVIELLSEGEGT